MVAARSVVDRQTTKNRNSNLTPEHMSWWERGSNANFHGISSSERACQPAQGGTFIEGALQRSTLACVYSVSWEVDERREREREARAILYCI